MLSGLNLNRFGYIMNSVAPVVTLSPGEFTQYQRLIYDVAGISMSDAKQILVQGRLASRLKSYQLKSYKQYFDLIVKEPRELQVAVDLLTTNETYFFRESKHIDFLRDNILPISKLGRPFRLWSAASSSGEEPYTLAMVLADHFKGSPWEILGSDLSSRVLEKAKIGSYPLERAENIPQDYLKTYCMKGIGKKSGTFLISSELQKHMEFTQINLVERLPDVGLFDVIFLRNVMIYFNVETKIKVINQLLKQLRPGGYFIVGHSESLHGMGINLETICPSVYQKL